MRGFVLCHVLAISAFTSNSANGFAPTTQRARTSTDLAMTQENPVSPQPMFGRRKALQTILGGGVVAVIAPTANALDMDSFANSQLDEDSKNCDPKRDPKCAPKLSADEALCKYGQSGNARGEACKRLKAAGGELPGIKKEKSLGGAYAM